MFITCIMSGSGDRRLEGGVECLSGDWDPWEATGTGKRWGDGERSPADKYTCSTIKGVAPNMHHWSWISFTWLVHYNSSYILYVTLCRTYYWRGHMILLQRVLTSHHLLPTSSGSHRRGLGWTISPLSPSPLSAPSTRNPVTNPGEDLLGGHTHVESRGTAAGPNTTPPAPCSRWGCSPTVPVIVGVTDSCGCRSAGKDWR